jgi:hypothetical protein
VEACVIAEHIQRLNLPPAAAAWLLDVWEAFQLLDDVVDGDKPIERARLDTGIYMLLVRLPSNPFYLVNAQALSTMLASAVMRWKASDDAERARKADERSFVWRAGYYDVVLEVVRICHGADVAMTAARDILSLYGETFEAYRQEFPNA